MKKMIAHVLHEPQLQRSSGAIGVELYSFHPMKVSSFSEFRSSGTESWVIRYRRFEVPVMVTTVHYKRPISLPLNAAS
jgi:hypothetical protein